MPEGTYREVYEPKVREAARSHGVPEHILVAMIAAESKFDPKAINHASGASGIAQLMPDTARELGVDPFDPEAAIDAGARYLSQLIDHFDGDLRAAVAAYNAGPGTVSKIYGYNRDNWQDELPEETQTYLETVFKPQRGPGGGATSFKPGELPPPSPDDYTYYDEGPDGELMKRVDSGAYYNAYSGWLDLTKTQTVDLSQQLDDVMAGLSLDIEAGRLNLDKASREFDRRFTAFQEGGAQFENLLGYAVPKNALHVPGREPGGFYESQAGLSPRPASGEFYNPFEEALRIVNQTPDLSQVQTPAAGVGSANNLFAQAQRLDQLNASMPASSTPASSGGQRPSELELELARRFLKKAGGVEGSIEGLF